MSNWIHRSHKKIVLIISYRNMYPCTAITNAYNVHLSPKLSRQLVSRLFISLLLLLVLFLFRVKGGFCYSRQQINRVLFISSIHHPTRMYIHVLPSYMSLSLTTTCVVKICQKWVICCKTRKMFSFSLYFVDNIFCSANFVKQPSHLWLVFKLIYIQLIWRCN